MSKIYLQLTEVSTFASLKCTPMEPILILIQDLLKYYCPHKSPIINQVFVCNALIISQTNKTYPLNIPHLHQAHNVYSVPSTAITSSKHRIITIFISSTICCTKIVLLSMHLIIQLITNFYLVVIWLNATSQEIAILTEFSCKLLYQILLVEEEGYVTYFLCFVGNINDHEMALPMFLSTKILHDFLHTKNFFSRTFRKISNKHLMSSFDFKHVHN